MMESDSLSFDLTRVSLPVYDHCRFLLTQMGNVFFWEIPPTILIPRHQFMNVHVQFGFAGQFVIQSSIVLMAFDPLRFDTYAE